MAMVLSLISTPMNGYWMKRIIALGSLILMYQISCAPFILIHLIDEYNKNNRNDKTPSFLNEITKPTLNSTASPLLVQNDARKHHNCNEPMDNIVQSFSQLLPSTNQQQQQDEQVCLFSTCSCTVSLRQSISAQLLLSQLMENSLTIQSQQSTEVCSSFYCTWPSCQL